MPTIKQGILTLLNTSNRELTAQQILDYGNTMGLFVCNNRNPINSISSRCLELFTEGSITRRRVNGHYKYSKNQNPRQRQIIIEGDRIIINF